MVHWGPFLEAPGNYRPVLFSIKDGSFKSFENCTVKLSAKELKWPSSEVRTHPTFLEISILKYYFGPVKLPGLSRSGPQVLFYLHFKLWPHFTALATTVA